MWEPAALNFFSPAKLNLFFKVLHKREDGYHEIVSLMGAISLGDHLKMGLAKSDQLICNDPSIPLGPDNLIWKAVALFRRESGLDSKLNITLEKRVPSQAGLGGGSSNAATTLWGLNQLFRHPFSQEHLLNMSQEIGSDVPFFFSHGCALSRGRGEKITPYPPLALTSCFVAKPRASLSTPAVYKETRVPELPPRDLSHVLQELEGGRPMFFNDLEAAAFRLEPHLSVLKTQLFSLGFSDVVMTGSGSAFFCFGDVTDPHLKDVTFFKAHFLERNEAEWWV